MTLGISCSRSGVLQGAAGASTPSKISSRCLGPVSGGGGRVGPVDGFGGQWNGWERAVAERVGGRAGGSTAGGRVARRAHLSVLRCRSGRLRRPWPPVVDGARRSADILPPMLGEIPSQRGQICTHWAKSGHGGDKFRPCWAKSGMVETNFAHVGRNPVMVDQFSPTLGEIRLGSTKFRPLQNKRCEKSAVFAISNIGTDQISPGSGEIRSLGTTFRPSPANFGFWAPKFAHVRQTLSLAGQILPAPSKLF